MNQLKYSYFIQIANFNQTMKITRNVDITYCKVITLSSKKFSLLVCLLR